LGTVTGTESLIVESWLTQADWTAWVAAWGERARARVGRARLLGAILVPLLTGLTLLLALRGGWRPLALIPFLVGGCSFLFCIALTQRLYQRAGQPTAEGWFLGPVRVELSAEGIRTHRTHSDTMTRWSAVRDVTRTPSHVFLWVDSSQAFLLPVRDLADGQDADRLVEWARALSDAETAPAAARAEDWTPPEEPVAGPPPIGFGRTLWQRLRWRAAPEGARASDGVIACCAALALAVWLAFDRHAAGPGAYWYLGGVSGLSWYALAVFGLAWVLHRATTKAARYRSLLAAVMGALPLALLLGLSIHQWVPPSWRPACYVLLALSLIVHVHRALVAATGGPQPRALAAAALSVLLFAWGTSKAWIDPHLWYETGDEEEDEGEDDAVETERLLFEQADRIDTAAARLAAGRPGRPDVFFLGFAGVGEQKVFAEEIKLSERVVAERYGAAGRSMLLINDRRDRDSWPLATVHGLKRALARMGERMDRDEDVLFLMLTSHGSEEPSLSVSNQMWPLSGLEGQTLREALDASRIRWRVIVISACYSGAFIDFLADENTIVVTSAAADKTSFGCSDDRDVTDFGAAFMRDALPEAPSLSAAFETAKQAIAAQERLAKLEASSPQARFGSAIDPYWTDIEAKRR
jgi:hypothetical protein